MEKPTPRKTILWVQRDLRLRDNPALCHAAERGEVIPVYVGEDAQGPASPAHFQKTRRRAFVSENAQDQIAIASNPVKSSADFPDDALGGAGKFWLHHSLRAFDAALQARGVRLLLRRGDPLAVIPDLLDQTGADAVVWNRGYEPLAIEKAKSLKALLAARAASAKSFKAGLLFEPWEIANQQGGYFKVFTPFWKRCLAQSGEIGAPLGVPPLVPSTHFLASEDLRAWELLPTRPDWSGGLAATWQPGEGAALKRLDTFLESRLGAYAAMRDMPAIGATSALSPHLHWGEVSPRQVWHATRAREAGAGPPGVAEKFLSELGWREFSHHLLFHVPSLPARPLNPKFDDFPWAHNPQFLRAWQRGKTGYPLVDAGMRELWATGYMHNRVRMIVASFLTKHLLIDWRCGAAWFWDTLVDADLANNSASWQWVAGCGADAAPYYRIFNPILQGERFDPSGVYVRRWVSELSRLPDAAIHRPWEADRHTLQSAGVELGKDYPFPIIDHAEARAAALNAYKSLG